MSDAAHLLSEWQDKLAIITRNANELYEAEFTKRIRNRVREGRYVGLTAERADAAVAKLTALMDDYLVLARVVEEATEVGRGSLFTARETTDAKVRELLLGYSVELPAVHVPLPKRDLLTEASASQHTRPSELLAAMQQAFAEARDSLNAIDEAENSLQQQMAALQQEVSDITERAASLGAEGEFPRLITSLEERSDPLQAQLQLQAYRRELAAWQRKLQALAAEREAAMQALARARDSIGQLETLEQTWQEALGKAQELFGVTQQTVTLAPLAQSIADFRLWLQTLERILAEHRWQAAKTGLARLQAGLDELRTQAEASRAATCGDVTEYEDIKARFKVLQFKVERLGLLDANIDRLAATVQDHYRARPVNMEQLRLHIKAYEGHLLALQSQNGAAR